MHNLKTLFAFGLLTFALSAFGDDSPKYFELRTYYANEGKLEELHARFRDHTLALFEKHGMINLAYWTPIDNESETLVYLLGFPDKEARDESFQAFRDDPEWKDVSAKSEKDGKLVAKVESLFLTPTEYSPEFPTESADHPRLFEMRRYTTNPDKLDALDARFRDHTIDLFEKHGLTNVAYFHLAEGQEKSETTLLYFLAFENEEKRNSGFKAFSQDAAWQSAREASEKDGKLLIKKGVESTFLVPTDYSPLR